MKKLIQRSILSLLLVTTVTACGEKCKMCHAEVGLGGTSVSSQAQELCGDQLKKAETTPGMVCTEK